MSDLELLISKHLDNELTPSELVDLRVHLASNPDAMMVYREMTAIRRAARRGPALRAPLTSTETQLFDRLRREGFRGYPTPSASSSTARTPRRRVAAMTAALVASIVALVVGIGSRVDVATVDSTATASSRSIEIPFAASVPDATRDAGSSALSQSGSRIGSSALSQSGSRFDVPSGRIAQETLAAGLPVRNQQGSDRSASRVESSASRDDRSASLNERSASRSHLARSIDAIETLPLATNATIRVAGPSPAITSDSVNTIQQSASLLALIDGSDRVVAPAVLPVPGLNSKRDPVVSASLRFGTSFIAASSARSEDLSIGVDVNIGNGHHLALLGGRSAAVTEQRAVNTHSVAARSAFASADAASGVVPLARTTDVPAPYELEVGQEWWLGAGYNFSVNASEHIELGAGVRGGVGVQALHVGGELAIRYRVTKTIAVEFTPTVAHVMPHDRGRNEFAIESVADGYLYDAETRHTAFSTYGAAVGVRIALQ